MGTKKKTEWSESKIQNILRWNFLSNSTKKYEMYNLFVYAWESDYLAITKSGYAYECEIKISRSDFKNEEKHKQHKRLVLEGKKANYQRPNYFYYVTLVDLITVDEVPENCGLIYVTEWNEVRIIKQAPKIHNEKVNIEGLKLIDKFYYTMWNWRDKWTRNNCDDLLKDIKSLTKTIMEYDDMLSQRQNEIDELTRKLKEYEDRASEKDTTGK